MRVVRGCWVLLLVVVAVVVGGCGGGGREPVSSSSSSPSPSSSVSVSPSVSPSPSSSPSVLSGGRVFPSPGSGESGEVAAVRRGWEANVRQIDRYIRDSSLVDATELVGTATGEGVSQTLEAVEFYRNSGRTYEGFIEYRDVEITSPKRNPSGVNVAMLTVCNDFSNLTILDSDGKPAKTPKGKVVARTTRSTYTMEQLPSGKWVVANSDTGRAAC